MVMLCSRKASIVVDPVQRHRLRCLAGTVALVFLALSFACGRFLTVAASEGHPQRQVRHMQQNLADREAHIDRLEQQLADALVGARLDREVISGLRSNLQALEQNVADTREQVAIYKGLLTPGGGGLSIRSWSVFPIGGKLHYRLVVQQLTDRHADVSGEALVTITGVDTLGKARVVSVQAPGEQPAVRPIALSFAYFQVVEGELVLPLDFKPQHIDVIARANGPQALRTERRFDWAVQEGAAHVGETKGWNNGV